MKFPDWAARRADIKEIADRMLTGIQEVDPAEAESCTVGIRLFQYDGPFESVDDFLNEVDERLWLDSPRWEIRAAAPEGLAVTLRGEDAEPLSLSVYGKKEVERSGLQGRVERDVDRYLERDHRPTWILVLPCVVAFVVVVTLSLIAILPPDEFDDTGSVIAECVLAVLLATLVALVISLPLGYMASRLMPRGERLLDDGVPAWERAVSKYWKRTTAFVAFVGVLVGIVVALV